VTSPSGLHELVRFIAARAGVDPARAEEIFHICTEPLSRSAWPDVAWRFSRLTADGSPVEFAFSTASEGLRYTVEVAGPEIPERDRIDAACLSLARLGYQCPPDALIQEWKRTQASGPLRWGCWLGVRQRGAHVEAKLYVEAPRGAGPPFLVMTGYEAGTGRIESYFRKKLMGVGEVQSLKPEAAAALERLWGMPIETALGFFTHGYSVSGDEVAFFLRTGWMGGPAAVRRRFLERGPGGDVGIYSALTGGIADDQLPDHGVVTLGFGPRREEEMRLGLSALALASRMLASD
jgi:hypothetical protein